jgi:4'-phosphopantetheinyl transferase EntD
LNPARLSAALAGLYPRGIIAAELSQPAPPGLLTDEELRSVGHCAPQRIADFAAGRLCARRALEEFGVSGFSLLSAPDRQPLWPGSLVGSITHTAGYSAAVVGCRGSWRSVGIDCEAVSAVRAPLWPRILGAAELKHLQTVALASRDSAAALMFAAKEAFYKCQFPLTGEWLEFGDIEVESADWDRLVGAFSVRPQRRIRLQARMREPVYGRFRVHGPFVSCGVALPA